MNCICCSICCSIVLIVLALAALLFVYKLLEKVESIWMQYLKYHEDRKSAKRKVTEEYRKMYLECLKAKDGTAYEEALKQLSEI